MPIWNLLFPKWKSLNYASMLTPMTALFFLTRDYGVFLIYGAHTPINLLKDLIEFNFKNDLKVSHN